MRPLPGIAGDLEAILGLEAPFVWRAVERVSNIAGMTARTFGLLAALSSAALCGAQLPDPVVSPIVGAHSLALNSDGSRLALVYRGDVWVVDAKGGRAFPVTTHVAMDDNPVWSPDGKWIAFSSDRNGGTDVYVVPAEGGRPDRLTYMGGMRPGDWSPDGKRIVIDTSIDKRFNGLYEVDVVGGRIREAMLDNRAVNQPRYSADGKQIVYERQGFPWYRPRYHGSGAAETWSLDRTTGATKRWFESDFQQLWPALDAANGRAMAVTVSELTPSSSPKGKTIGKNTDNAKRTPNVYEFGADGKERQVTAFVGGAVRDLTVSRKNGWAAFTYEGQVYTMQNGRGPKPLEIIASSDDKTDYTERLILVDGATEGSLSPDGSQIAFAAHDELWLVPTKKGEGPNKDDATQLSDWPGLDRSPLWAPDGKRLYFTSDRDGAERLYVMDVATKDAKALSVPGRDVSGLRLSPDKKSLYYWMQDSVIGGLYSLPVDGTASTLVLNLPNEFDTAFDVSPDGRYIAYSYNDAGTLINQAPNVNVFVYDTVGRKSTQLTRLNAQHTGPVWSVDGKYLYFVSNREGAGGGGPGGFGGGAAVGSGLFVLPLKREAARPTELELKYTKPEGPVTVEIDFTDTDARVRSFLNQPVSGQAAFNPETGDVYFLSAGDVWKVGYSGEGARKLTATANVRSMAPSGDWSSLFLVLGGKLATMNLKSPQFPVTTVDFRADWVHDIEGERKAAFAQFWRGFNSGFYDPNMHGRDWAAIRRRYEPLLPSVGHNEEFARLLNMMTGELESSHSEIRAASTPGPSGDSAAHLGFTIDWSYDGPGIKVKEVPFNAPGSFEKTKIEPGEIVLAVNGKPVGPDMSLFRNVLNGQSGRDLTLTVSPDGTKEKAREVKYRALSAGAFRAIYYDNEIRARRKYVEEKSGGRLTYVHIAGMGGGNLATFNLQLWEYALGKEGVIIDVRDNGGGSIADQLVDMLERKPHAFYQSRDGVASSAPGRDIDVPMVVLQAETSYSNAEMFPAAMKARGLATLVGVPTPGYVIWTSGFRLVDGTTARMPNSASYRLDGSPMEDMGQVPDVLVDVTREEALAGKDPQLDKAIDVLMAKLVKR